MSDSISSPASNGTTANAAPTTPVSAPSNPTPNAPSKGPAPAPSTTSATPQGTPTSPSTPQTFTFKYKVDGADKTFRGTEAELITFLQKAEGSEKRFQEANALKKKFMEAITYGQQNPDQAIEAFKELFGHDFDEIAEKRLAAKYEESTLSEEEKARRKELADAKKAREELEGYKKRDSDTKRQQQEEALWQEMQKTYFSALDKLGYDKEPAILTLMADVDDAAMANGYELSDEQLVAETNRRLESAGRHVMKRLTKPGRGPELLDYLGPEGVKAVITAEMERRKMGTSQPVAAPKVEGKDNSRSVQEFNPKKFDEGRKKTRNEIFRMKMGLD